MDIERIKKESKELAWKLFVENVDKEHVAEIIAKKFYLRVKEVSRIVGFQKIKHDIKEFYSADEIKRPVGRPKKYKKEW